MRMRDLSQGDEVIALREIGCPGYAMTPKYTKGTVTIAREGFSGTVMVQWSHGGISRVYDGWVDAVKPQTRPPPYTGEPLDKGIFQITFSSVEGTFSGLDAAQDAARHSAWNHDSEFDTWNVKLVESSVPVETYQYICDSCKEYVTSEGYTHCRCSCCGEIEWVKRLSAK